MTKDKEQEFPPFNGLRSSYKKFKADITHIIQTVDRAGFIVQAAEACKDTLLQQYNALTSNSRRTFSTDFNNYKVALDAACTGKAKGIHSRVTAQSTKLLCEHIGNDWSDHTKRGVTEDEWKVTVNEERCEWLLHLHRTILKRLITAIFGADTQASSTPYIDSLRPIVLSKTNNDLLDGKYDTSQWLEFPNMQPLIITLATIFFKYEGIVDPQSLNLGDDLDTAHLIAKGLMGKTLWQLDSHLDEVFEPQLKLWGSLHEFFRHYRSTLLIKMIDTLAAQDSDDRHEWVQCKSRLAAIRHESKLHLEDIYTAIRITEEEIIKRRTSASNKEEQAKVATYQVTQTGRGAQTKATTPSTATPPPPQPPASQASMQAQLDEIRAMLAHLPGPTPKHQSRKNGKGKGTQKTGGKQPDGSVVYTYPLCPECGKHHQGGAAACIKRRDLSKELQDAKSQVQRIEHLKRIQGKIADRPPKTQEGGPTTGEKRLAAMGRTVTFEELPEDNNTRDQFCIGNDSGSSSSHTTPTVLCASSSHNTPMVCSIYNPDAPPTATQIYAYGTVLDVKKGPYIDSATQGGVTHNQQRVTAWDGRQYQLTGIAGEPANAQGCTIGFPTVSDTGTPLLFSTDSSLYCAEAKENLLSLAQILQAGNSVHFAAGRTDDPQYGGFIQTPDGHRITMIFENNLWRLPLWAPATSKHRFKPKQKVPSTHPILHNNAYAALMDLQDVEDRAENEDVHAFHLRTRTAPQLLEISQQMQLICNRWGHCGRTKHMQNYKFYKGTGFPRGFPTLLNNWSCPVCIGMKSQRQYRIKARQSSTSKPPDHASDNHSQQQDTDCDTESDSDEELSPTQQPTSPPDSSLGDPTGTSDHYYIDFGYSIAVGLRKEKYFLLVQLKDLDFMWALPTASRDNPVQLLQDFEALTGITPLSIQCDNEFANNSAVQAWVKRRNAVIRPTPAYNHTMNGRIEGAVRISKDHLRCLVKAANAPFRFWPFALKHFCRTYAWWAGKGGKKPPWLRMPARCNLYHNRERDLRAWGCLVTGRLPTEHPLVQVDKTNADRSLQGAFLGWHDTSPTFWMYSFKLQRVLRLCDPIFSEASMPFADPTVLLNKNELTDEMVLKMHGEDIFLDFEQHPADTTIPSEATVSGQLQPTSSMRTTEPKQPPPLDTSGEMDYSSPPSAGTTHPSSFIRDNTSGELRNR